MYKKSAILMTAVLVLLGSIAVAICDNSKMSPSNHPVLVVTPSTNGSGYLGDVLVQGIAIIQFNRVGAWGWIVHIDKVVDGPREMQNRLISVFLTSADPTKYPRGFLDPNIRAGGRVEAYGESSSGSTNLLLTGNAKYYLKRVEPTGSPKWS